jgi:hypothetical protein
MLMLVGPHTALGNIPRSIEYNVDWVADFIRYMNEHGFTRADVTPAGMTEWTDYVRQTGKGLLSNEIDSWMTGVNTNVEGRQTRRINRYSGSAPFFRDWCTRVANAGYVEVDKS